MRLMSLFSSASLKVDVAEQYFQESMTILKKARGIANDRFFAIQDEFCRFLRTTGKLKVRILEWD